MTCCLISSGNFFPQYRTIPCHTINANGDAVLQKILKLAMLMRKVLIFNCLSQTHNIVIIQYNAERSHSL